MHEILTQILAIPNYKVVGVEMTEDAITINIESTLGGLPQKLYIRNLCLLCSQGG